jgi:hypothetical protein
MSGPLFVRNSFLDSDFMKIFCPLGTEVSAFV